MARIIPIGVLLLVWSSVLLAQERPLIEEIIVTAQRVEESAQKVPIALSAFNDTDIEDRQIVGLAELQIQVPNLNYTTTNIGDMALSIRGVGSLVSVNDGESGVSLHLNEIPLPPGQPPIELYDIQRIEVLRGPSGTLYGRNATGGVINILPQEPSLEGFAGYMDVEAGNHDSRRLRGAINIPVVETLAIRVAGLYLERDGFTDNLAGGQVPGIAKEIDDRDLYGLRGSILWQVSDRTRVLALYERFEEDDSRMVAQNFLCKTALTPAPRSGCEPGVYGLGPMNQAGINPTIASNGVRGITVLGARDASTGLVYQYPRPKITNLRDVHLDFEPIYEVDQNLAQLTIAHDFEWGTLTAKGGYQEWVRHWARDWDWSVGHELNAIPENPSGLYPVSSIPDGVAGLSDPGCNLEAGLAGYLGGCVLDSTLTRWFSYNDDDEERKHWSGEVKLRTQSDGRFNFLVGGNYQFSQSDTLQSRFGNDGIEVITRYGTILNPGILSPEVNPDFAFILYPPFVVLESHIEFESISAFGEAYVEITDDLKLTVGMRYNRDEKKIEDRAPSIAALDVNSPLVFDGIFGEGPVWVRRDANTNIDLWDYYGATEAIANATNIFELVEAFQIIPIVEQLNERRILDGTPTKQTWDAWSGRFGLDWTIGENALLYGFFSRGYKPGGFNPGTRLIFLELTSAEAIPTYEREDVDAYEIGLKGLFWQSSLSVNVAAFFYDYDDLQLTETSLEQFSVGPINTNVDAEMFGAEVELTWRPLFAPRAQLELGYSWLDAELKNEFPRLDPLVLTGGNADYVLLHSWSSGQSRYVAPIVDVLPLVDAAIADQSAWGPDDAPAAQYPNGIPAWLDRQFLDANGVETLDGIPVEIDGNQLPEAPKNTVHLGVSYTWDLAGGALTARWDYYWQDRSYLTVFNRPSHRIDSWDQHNAMLVYESADGRWSARAWVRNIEDDVHITGGHRSNDQSFAVSDPRVYGASFRYNFGAL